MERGFERVCRGSEPSQVHWQTAREAQQLHESPGEWVLNSWTRKGSGFVDASFRGNFVSSVAFLRSTPVSRQISWSPTFSAMPLAPKLRQCFEFSPSPFF
ncbi:hypothetical protein EV363DRAFT_1203307 [Boletus edulis]|nr:hypothetical protein EV363DRAFT_1203307 [Boletus edulis]